MDRALADDTPCTVCRYNLRGLTPGGRCPECGRGVADTLAELVAAARPVAPDLARADTSHVAAWRQGLLCALMAAGLAVVVAMAPDDMRRRFSVARAVLLALSVVAWSCNGLGLWLVGRRDLAVDRRAGAMTGWLVQFAALGWGLMPVAVVLDVRNPGQVLYRYAVPLEVGGVLAAVTFHLRLRHLAHAAGRQVLGDLCVALAVAVSLVIVARSDGRDDYEAPSLDVIQQLPWPTAVSPSLAVEVARSPWSWRHHAEGLFFLGVPLVDVCVVVACQLRVLRPAGIGGSTAASSRP